MKKEIKQFNNLVDGDLAAGDIYNEGDTFNTYISSNRLPAYSTESLELYLNNNLENLEIELNQITEIYSEGGNISKQDENSVRTIYANIININNELSFRRGFSSVKHFESVENYIGQAMQKGIDSYREKQENTKIFLTLTGIGIILLFVFIHNNSNKETYNIENNISNINNIQTTESINSLEIWNSGYVIKGQSTKSPSFDCHKAKMAVEKSICNNELLAELDAKLGKSYKKLRNILPFSENQKLLIKQREWLRKRNTICSPYNIDCLENLYKTRILELENILIE